MLEQLTGWRREGLVDVPTYQLLRSLYEDRAPAEDATTDPAPAQAPAQAPPAQHQSELDLALEQEARRLEEEEPPEPPVDLDADLEQEVAFHLELEQQVARQAEQERSARALACSTPPAQRPAPLAEAAGEAAQDIVRMDPGQPAEAPTTPAEHVLQRDSTWPERLRPLLHGNALWLASGLLILFGSLYFLRLIWDDLSSQLLHLAIAGALLSYAGAFFGVGYVLARWRDAHALGRILFCFSAALLPLAGVATGELAGVLIRGGGPGGLLLAILAVALALTAQGGAMTVMAGLFERSSIRPLVPWALALSLLTMAVAPLRAVLGSGPLPLAAIPLGLVALHRGLMGLCAAPVHLRVGLLFGGGSLLWSLMVLVGRVQVAHPISLTYHAPLLAVLAWTLVTFDHRLRAREDLPARLTPLGLALHAVALAALALCLGGLARHGYFDLPSRVCVLATSAVCVVLFAQGAIRHGRGALTHLAASSGLLVYFFLPAPFTGLIQLLRQHVNEALGYQHQPLPVAFYGLAFIPYIAGLTGLAAWLPRRRDDLARDLQLFLAGLGGLLVLLAATSGGGDLRPMLWAWPIYAAAAFAWSRIFARPWLVHAGHAVTLASIWVLGAELSGQVEAAAPSTLLALHAVVMGMAALRWSSRRHRHLAWASLGACGLAVGALLLTLGAETSLQAMLHWISLTTPPCTVALALAAARFRSRSAAHAAALLSVAAVLVCGVHWLQGGRALLVAVCVHALAGAALLWWARSRSPLRRRLVVEPALAATLLSSYVALALGAVVAPVASSAICLGLFVHLGRCSRGWPALLLAACGAALSLVLLAAEADPRLWPPALALLACAYMLAAPRLPGGQGRSRALAAVAVLAAAAAVAGGLLTAALAWEGSLLWAALAMAEAALFGLAVTVAYVRFEPAGRAGLALLGLASAASATLMLQHLLPSTPSSAWGLGVLLCALSLAWSETSPRLRGPGLGQTARQLGAALLLLPLSYLGFLVGTSALQCVVHGAGIQGPLSPQLEAGALVFIGALLLTLALRHKLMPGTFTLHTLLAGFVGLSVVIFKLAAPSAHLTPALVFPALALAWRFRSLEPCSRCIWPPALALGALVSSHGHLGHGHLLLALAAGTAVLLIRWRHSSHREGARLGLLQAGWSVGLALCAQALVLLLAESFPEAIHPSASVTALQGAAALLMALLLAHAGHRISGPVSDARARTRLPAPPPALRVGAARRSGAGRLALAALFSPGPAAPLPPVLLCLSILGALCAIFPLFGLRRRRPWMVHAGGLALTALYVAIRTRTFLSAVGPQFDAALLLLSAQAAFWTARTWSRARNPLLGRPLLLFAGLWPLATPLLMAQLSTEGAALAALLVSLHYSVMARVLRRRRLAALAMAFGNLSLMLSYAVFGWSDLLLYVLPVSATLLVLVHLFKDELGKRGTNLLRALLLVSLYTLSTGKALLSLSPVQSLLVVPLICVAGMVAGVLLRVRVYVLMGISFLAADLLLNMLRHGLRSPHLGALFLTLLGLALVAGMVFFTLERERILRRYSAIFAELQTWE